jgi:hypothetical protein
MDAPQLKIDSLFESAVRAGYRNHTLPRRFRHAATLTGVRLHPDSKYYEG